MRLTNNTAIKLLRRAKCSELDESIRTYPEDERGDKTDIEILRDEIYYLIEMYEEARIRLNRIEEIAREAFNNPDTINIDLYRAQKLAEIFQIFEYNGSTIPREEG